MADPPPQNPVHVGSPTMVRRDRVISLPVRPELTSALLCGSGGMSFPFCAWAAVFARLTPVPLDSPQLCVIQATEVSQVCPTMAE